jgi:hypothetical protein
MILPSDFGGGGGAICILLKNFYCSKVQIVLAGLFVTILFSYTGYKIEYQL